jgi:hypothetical protein
MGPFGSLVECQNAIRTLEATYPYRCVPASSLGAQGSPGPLGTTAVIVSPGLLGGLGGYFWQSPTGEYFGPYSGLAGLGLGLDLAVGFKRLKSRPAKIAATSLGNGFMAIGATRAYQFDQAWQKHLDTGYVPPTTATEVKQVAIVATPTVVATAVIGIMITRHVGTKSSQMRNPFVRNLGKIQLAMMKNGASMSFGW